MTGHRLCSQEKSQLHCKSSDLAVIYSEYLLHIVCVSDNSGDFFCHIVENHLLFPPDFS